MSGQFAKNGEIGTMDKLIWPKMAYQWSICIEPSRLMVQFGHGRYFVEEIGIIEDQFDGIRVRVIFAWVIRTGWRIWWRPHFGNELAVYVTRTVWSIYRIVRIISAFVFIHWRIWITEKKIHMLIIVWGNERENEENDQFQILNGQSINSRTILFINTYRILQC